MTEEKKSKKRKSGSKPDVIKRVAAAMASRRREDMQAWIDMGFAAFDRIMSRMDERRYQRHRDIIDAMRHESPEDAYYLLRKMQGDDRTRDIAIGAVEVLRDAVRAYTEEHAEGAQPEPEWRGFTAPTSDEQAQDTGAAADAAASGFVDI